MCVIYDFIRRIKLNKETVKKLNCGNSLRFQLHRVVTSPNLGIVTSSKLHHRRLNQLLYSLFPFNKPHNLLTSTVHDFNVQWKYAVFILYPVLNSLVPSDGTGRLLNSLVLVHRLPNHTIVWTDPLPYNI